MILVDWKIRELLDEKELIIEPFLPDQISTASIDLRLGADSVRFQENLMEDRLRHIDHVWQKQELIEMTVVKEHILGPKSFGLYTTIETIRLSDTLCGQLEGRSSIGRQGLIIHTAGFIQPGYHGQLTLELFNVTDHSISLPVGIRICQLVLSECHKPEIAYNHRISAKYLDQKGVTLSKLKEEIR